MGEVKAKLYSEDNQSVVQKQKSSTFYFELSDDNSNYWISTVFKQRPDIDKMNISNVISTEILDDREVDNKQVYRPAPSIHLDNNDNIIARQTLSGSSESDSEDEYKKQLSDVVRDEMLKNHIRLSQRDLIDSSQSNSFYNRRQTWEETLLNSIKNNQTQKF
jgi:hypothetical protein